MAIETLSNSSNLEIIGSNGITVTSKTLNPGETNEAKQFSISGRVQLNKPTIVGTMKLTAAENKRFLKAPGIGLKNSNRVIDLNSGLRMKLTSTEKDTDGNISIYLYDLIYTGKEKVSKINKLKYKLSNETIPIVSKVTGIQKIDIGKMKVKRNGEKRKITIYGDPYSAFKLSINKFIESKAIDSFGNPAREGAREESILNDAHANSVTADGRYKIIDGKLNSKGIYTFNQSFPALQADSDDSTRYLTLGNYSVNILPTVAKSSFTGWTKSRKSIDTDWTGWYSKLLKQKFVATVKLQATANNVLYTINRQVIPGGAGTQTFTRVILPKKDEIKVKYILRPVSASHAFGILKTPSYSKTGGTSDWTGDVNMTSNGKTDIDISNISLVLSTTTISNDTATFSFTMKINKRGYKDVTIGIPLNTLVSCS